MVNYNMNEWDDSQECRTCDGSGGWDISTDCEVYDQWEDCPDCDGSGVTND